MESDLEQQLRLVEQELHQVQGTHAISNLKSLQCAALISQTQGYLKHLGLVE